MITPKGDDVADLSPRYDVFVSYTALSQVGENGASDAWPTHLASQLVAELDALRPPQPGQARLYLYETRARGEAWRKHVAASCRSRVLLPIVSETYFTSETCFLEWYAFVTGNPEFGQYQPIRPHRLDFIVPVWRLEGESLKINDALRKSLYDVALEAIPPLIAARWRASTAEVEKLVQIWVDSTFDRNGVNLSLHIDSGPRQFSRGDLSRLIAELATSIDALLARSSAPASVSDEQTKLVTLSLLALGLDRFHAGGWGFSMGAEFERDSGGRLFPQGRDELNQLVLRSLRWAISPIDFLHETEVALLWSLREERLSSMAQSRVKDRKQRALALSALLHSVEIKPVRDRLMKHREHLATEVSHSPFDQRWVVETAMTPSKIEDFDDVAFFDFAARARTATHDPEMAIGLGLAQAEVDRNYAAAEKSLREWLHQHDILQTMNVRFFELADAPDEDAKVHRLSRKDDQTPRPHKAPHDIMMLMLHFHMLSTIPASAEMIGALSPTTRAIRSIEPKIEKIVTRLKREDRTDAELQMFLSVYPLYCLALTDLAHHYTLNNSLTQHADLCRRCWLDLLECIGAAEVSRCMNAAGWAASIILAERQGANVDRTVLAKIWSLAKRARDRRREVAVEAVSRPRTEARATFDQFVREEVQRIEAELGPDILALKGDPNLLRPMFSFGGNGAGWKPEVAERVGEAVGLLLVDAETDKILSATVGFNSIYIEPFSARLGIGLNSLERLVFELGETDTKFIDSLSQSVVEHCWPLDDVTGPALEEVSFAERSQAARQRVQSQPRNNRNDPGVSVRDLLQLKLGADGRSRYVLRTCNRVHPQDLVGVAPSLTGDEPQIEGIIQWTFVDITEWMDSGVFQLAKHLVRAS